MALETVEDIIRALQEHPEWREPLLNARTAALSRGVLVLLDTVLLDGSGLV
ncbi:hypothetical protein HRbin16_01994 [bacterium HR16]|nr:hypothetical protein HRbin16_01994 [bacterium HR16]